MKPLYCIKVSPAFKDLNSNELKFNENIFLDLNFKKTFQESSDKCLWILFPYFFGYFTPNNVMINFFLKIFSLILNKRSHKVL